MSEIKERNRAIEAVVEKAQEELQAVDPSPFSSNAYTLLKLRIAEYVSDLVNESVKIAKRHRADTVSAAHVEQASQYLVSSTSKRIYRHLGTVGGILFGAALSTILAMTVTGQFTAVGTIVSVVLGFIGAFLIAFHIAKD